MVTLPDALSPADCTFVEQDGLMIDSETGLEASIDAPCVIRGVSIGYNSEAARQAVEDVEAFLGTVFSVD